MTGRPSIFTQSLADAGSAVVCPVVKGMSASGRAAMPVFKGGFECQQYHWHWQIDAGTHLVHRRRAIRSAAAAARRVVQERGVGIHPRVLAARAAGANI